MLFPLGKLHKKNSHWWWGGPHPASSWIWGGWRLPCMDDGESHIISTDQNSVCLTAENVMGMLQKCQNQAAPEWNLSFQKVNQISNAILETLQLLGNRNPTGFNLTLICHPNILQRYFQQGSLWISFRFLIHQGCCWRSWLGARSRRENKKQKALKILVLENWTTNWKTTAQDSGLSEGTYKRGPQAWSVSFPSLKCFFLKQFRFSPSSRGSNRKEEAGKAGPNVLSSGCPSRALTTELMGKWPLIKSLHKKETVLPLNALCSSRVG